MKKFISVLAISLLLVGTATVGVFAHNGEGRHMNGPRSGESGYRQGEGRHEHDEECLEGEHRAFNNQNVGTNMNLNVNRGRMGLRPNNCH